MHACCNLISQSIYFMCFKSNLMTLFLFIWYFLHMLYMFLVLITHLQEQILRIEAVGITTCKMLHSFSMYSYLRTASVVWWLACWPLVPEFAGSIPTEAVGFFPM
jgi:hypothetical protein